jgi:photosystem II stability/assembly factor-like uncharacterized protein
MKQLFYLLLLISLVACEKNEDEAQEPTLQTVTVTAIKTENSETFTDISFGTSKVGYICGSIGTLLKTTDSGKTWTEIQSDIQPSLNCIQALDEKNVYTARNELYHTKDGGVNWETAGLENVGSGIFDLFFLSPSIGFIAKNGVMKSTDSGKTWNIKFDPGTDEEYYALNYNQLQFINEHMGYCAGGKTYDGNTIGNMVKTTDGGETWTSLKMKMSQITAFHFLDANNGFIFNFNQELWKTTDGGTSWTKVSGEIPEKYPDCYFVNASKIILRTSKDIYHSVDGGLTWIKDFTLTATDGQLTNMKFTDSRIGYIVGNNGFLAKITLN